MYKPVHIKSLGSEVHSVSFHIFIHCDTESISVFVVN